MTIDTVKSNWVNKESEGTHSNTFNWNINTVIQPNFTFEINEELSKVKMFTQDKRFIWSMYKGILWLAAEKWVHHNWLEIDEYFRWEGNAKILFEKFDDEFWVNDIEYSRRKDIVVFYSKQWYRITDVLDNSWETIWYFDDELESVDEYILNWYCIELSRE